MSLRFFQRNDPAVDQRLRRFFLAAKVVDDEDAAGGFELQRRLVGARVGLYLRSSIERQFAAGDHGGPVAQHIARVEAVRGAAQRVGSSSSVFDLGECTIGS
jgi:hypothetical protein